MTTDDDLDVLVIGAGVAGLTAARSLSATHGRVLVVEQADRVGGRVHSVAIDGHIVEAGASFVAPFYVTALALLDELGLSHLLADRSRPTYVVRGGTAQPLLPTGRLVTGGALSRGAKLKLAGLVATLARHWRRLDLADLPRAEALDDVSCATYLRGRIGEENVDFFISPLLRGMLYWDPATTSAAVLLSILRTYATAGPSRRLTGGLAQFPEALAQGLTVRTATTVEAVRRDAEGGYLVDTVADGVRCTLRARGVVCATTATTAARLLAEADGAGPADGAALEYLRSVTYAPTVVVTLAVRAPADAFPDGALLFPAAGTPELAAVNAYQRLTAAAPGSAASPAQEDRLVHVYLSPEGVRRFEGETDGQLAAAVVGLLERGLDRPAWLREARLSHVQRWEHALPRFDVGHLRRTRLFLAGLPAGEPLAFAGDYLEGPYLEGAVRSGLAAARRIRAALRSESELGVG